MGEFVNEFPLPPEHYKEFEGVDSLPVPVIDVCEGDGVDLAQEYKTNMGIPFAEGDEDERSFKVEELKDQLRSLMKELMEVVANPSIDSQSHQPRMESLQNSVDRVRDYVKLYKHHQAREDLCGLLRTQLTRTLGTEKELQRCVDVAAPFTWSTTYIFHRK